MNSNNEMLALDTERRRLGPDDPYELISIGLYSSTRGPLVCHPVRPLYDCPAKWEKQLGLAAGVLMSAPTYHSTCSSVRAHTMWRDVLVWNKAHEIEVMPYLSEIAESGRPLHNLQDVMRRCAPLLRDWNPYFGDYQFPSLADAADELGLSFSVGGHHTANSDAQMLIQIWNLLEANPFHLAALKEKRPELLLVDHNEDAMPF